MKSNQVIVMVTLAILMLVTRGSHVSGWNALPEASWMVFFAAGLLLPTVALPALFALAVGIDAYAFTFGGVPGTCLSVAYAMLAPAYASLWLAGRFAGQVSGSSRQYYSAWAGAALLGTAVCEVISSGSFYLWSGLFEPTWAEFVQRELRYAPAVFASTAFWGTILILVHAIGLKFFSAPSGIRNPAH